MPPCIIESTGARWGFDVDREWLVPRGGRSRCVRRGTTLTPAQPVPWLESPRMR